MELYGDFDSLSYVLMLGRIFGRTESGGIVGVADHQMHVGSRHHHTAIHLIYLHLTLFLIGGMELFF